MYMKMEENLVARCMDVLKQETALLERLAAAQELVRQSVFAREWADLETMLSRLSSYGDEFVLLEAERERLFSEISGLFGGERESISFYSLASRLPLNERKELTELYRRLKLDTLKVRLANEALTSYLSDARSTLSGFMDAAFPDRKGRIYSRRGKTVHSEMRSIVLDKSL
ncbi:hypothetical protein MASR2M78_04340 [Treponema sp.]